MEADFIIIGSGSAGSAMAARLSESGEHSVLVIEHGGSDRSIWVKMPAALSYPMNMPRFDWGFRTEPEAHLNNRRLACPRGKVIGGSSSINGMVYVRGNALDYDGWQQMGAKNWSYAHVLPYFRRMEGVERDDLDREQQSWRGTDGPLRVTRGENKNPLFDAFLLAGRQAGYPLTPDYNGQRQEGFTLGERTIWKGRRFSAADAYLKPSLPRDNLSLLRAFAKRIVLKGGRAVGVEVVRNGVEQTVSAKREVILAASAINSPKLLMLSGIGPERILDAHNIAPVAVRNGVGENLQDHLEVYIQQKCLQPITLNGKLDPLSKLSIGLQWLFGGNGPGASNQFDALAFLRSGEHVSYPDIQFHFLPAAIRYDGKTPAKGHGFQAHVGPMRSPSRGSVRLRSAHPQDPPLIRFNYMSTPEDWHAFRHCIRLAREIFVQEAFAPYRGDEIAPGAHLNSDDELDGFIRDHVESAYHPCGTCRMGDEHDEMAVVDHECRVIGVEGLRVADSSIFPSIPNGNLNAPSIMVGEKAADHILGKGMLPPADL
ncbi:MAG: choline dehydrogenase [Hyphomicrobiales bacterium]|nr:choline dehydrogenase [Hyphomicrobiales bacterium]MCY4052655.1 choline dehydrogenase [Hyphomicrobiales bacterium]